MFIKKLSAMGKTTNKKISDLRDLNEIQKEEMNDILGGKEHETKKKKKRWFSFCGGILQQ